MRSAIREKFLKHGVAGLFQLGDQELKETVEYIAAMRYRTAGRARTSKVSEQATRDIEARMAKRGITVRDIEGEIRKVRQTKIR